MPNSTSDSAASQPECSPPGEASHMKRLEEEHRNLEEGVRERLQSLKMQLSISDVPFSLTEGRSNRKLVEWLEREGRQAEQYHSERLLQAQIRIQEQAQMRQLIQCYEQRIGQLRGSLVAKQAQISYQTYEKKRSQMPKRQNMRSLNMQQQQFHILKRQLKQIQKLRYEVEAIEHTIHQYQQKRHQPFDLGPSTATFEGSKSTSRNSLVSNRATEKQTRIGLDPLLFKVFRLLEEEMKREEEGKEQLDRLDSELKELSEDNKELVARYNTLSGKRGNALESLNQPSADTDNILGQLEEGQKIRNNNEELLRKQDANKTEHIPTSVKSKSLNKVHTLEKRPSCKQN